MLSFRGSKSNPNWVCPSHRLMLRSGSRSKVAAALRLVEVLGIFWVGSLSGEAVFLVTL